MTPLDYAQLCAARYSIAGIKLKGHSHVPRVTVDRSKLWFKFLPCDKLVMSEQGGIAWITSAQIFNHYTDDLWAAGIHPTICEVVSRRAWLTAMAIVRLTGEPLPRSSVPEAAERVRTMMLLRRERMERMADRQLAAHIRNAAL